MLFSTALLRGEKSHVTERSVKGPAWNQTEDTTNMLFKRIITSACRFFFFFRSSCGIEESCLFHMHCYKKKSKLYVQCLILMQPFGKRWKEDDDDSLPSKFRVLQRHLVPAWSGAPTPFIRLIAVCKRWDGSSLAWLEHALLPLKSG